MIEWFKNLDDSNKIAIVVPVGIAAIGGLFALFKWLFKKESSPSAQQKTIHQEGSGRTAGNNNFIAGGDVNIGIERDNMLDRIVKIKKGLITFKSNTLNIKPFIGIKISITEGYLKRNDFGKLEVYIKACVPFESLQCLNEKLGLDSMHLFSESEIISVDSDNPTVFTSSTSHILPQGEMVLDISTWEEIRLPMTINVHTQTKASGHLKGKVFQGKFEANLTYHEINWQIGLNGDFQAHLT